MTSTDSSSPPRSKKKFTGENAARLYVVDIEANKQRFQDDKISEQFDLGGQIGSPLNNRLADRTVVRTMINAYVLVGVFVFVRTLLF